RGAVDQPHAEARLQASQPAAYHPRRQPKLPRGRGQASAGHHPHEHGHLIEFVGHLCILRKSVLSWASGLAIGVKGCYCCIAAPVASSSSSGTGALRAAPSGLPLFFSVESGAMASYSRAHPSPRYRELLALYARMHVEGETTLGIPPEQTFPGSSLGPHVARIKSWIERTGARTILDYGAGKGLQYRPQKVVVDGRHVADGIAEYWDVDEVRCFDPGYAPHNALPEGKFDGVICTDVLEHCPEEDL